MSDTLKQRLWAGHIPVAFTLDRNEVTTLHAPRPFYAMIPRLSYLVSHTRDVIEYFRDAAPPLSAIQGSSIWFEAQGVPLHWHLPFGLLRDLLCGAGSGNLPWSLTVHFIGFPDNVLLPCDTEQSVESYFMHSLKQAMFLRNGTTKSVMGLPEAQQMQIWTSIAQNNYENYQEATRELQLEQTSMMRHLPLRVHLDKTPAIQMPIQPLENGVEKTVLQVLEYLLPDIFPFNQDDTTAETDTKHFQLIVHGLVVPFDVSIVELYRNFAYADGFLYVTVMAL